MTITDRFAKAIEQKGVSRYLIAKETGIDQSRLSRLFSGQVKKPSAKNLKILADYFNVSEEWLLTGEGKGLNAGLMNEEEIKQQDSEVKDGICMEYTLPQHIASHPSYMRLIDKVNEQANTIEAQRETISVQRKYIAELERQLSELRHG